jgi:hypothetical protein
MWPKNETHGISRGASASRTKLRMGEGVGAVPEGAVLKRHTPFTFSIFTSYKTRASFSNRN